MNPDLQALAQKLDTDPKDALAIQALADYLEERGADPTTIRALTIDAPTVLIFGFPRDAPVPDDNFMKTVQTTADWLAKHSGHNVRAMWMRSDITIRVIKANVAKKDDS